MAPVARELKYQTHMRIELNIFDVFDVVVVL